VQPTISAQVKLLTETIGMPLFEQVGKKIYLTEVGRELQQTCRELFEVWSRFEMTVADLQGVKKGALRVAIATTAKYFIPQLLGPFCARYPGIEISLEIINRDQLIERLANNRDDLYIMGVPPQNIEVEQHRLLENPLVVIAPRNHALSSKRNLPLQSLASERMIQREQGSGTRISAEEFFDQHRIRFKTVMQLGNNEAIKWAVAGGLGIAVISQHALMLEPMHDKLAVLDVQGFPLRRSWYAVYPKGKRLSVVAQAFFDYVKQEAASIQGGLLSPGPQRPKVSGHR